MSDPNIRQDGYVVECDEFVNHTPYLLLDSVPKLPRLTLLNIALSLCGLMSSTPPKSVLIYTPTGKLVQPNIL